ncbi:hypothetical protein KSC_039630 [Ktedonobacter sp. SOSP1-52]|uniref:hypothetical protein n=1 Tax=Ktedonobacter sp. SOSP1-52 TaxID=2778366 RepID=UPI0019155599|nr:hypothetical protein [Ktedonobacter sp. SOSP1-52]GHO65071.1 hypothetical protein KSC_039630 [Ktedonobacter sp. SOSP1-52]
MEAKENSNPFHILRLPTTATNREIVERSQEFYDLAETDEQREYYRWAKEQLLTNPVLRLKYELFEMPDTQYEDEEWGDFVRKYKRHPVRRDALLKELPPLNAQDFDIAALLHMLLQDLLAVPEADISVAIEEAPKSEMSSPLEAVHVIFG